jgi:hypothetical protein
LLFSLFYVLFVLLGFTRTISGVSPKYPLSVHGRFHLLTRPKITILTSAFSKIATTRIKNPANNAMGRVNYLVSLVKEPY